MTWCARLDAQFASRSCRADTRGDSASGSAIAFLPSLLTNLLACSFVPAVLSATSTIDQKVVGEEALGTDLTIKSVGVDPNWSEAHRCAHAEIDSMQSMHSRAEERASRMQLETHSPRACLRYGVAPRVVKHCLAPSLQFVLTQQTLLPRLLDHAHRDEVDQFKRRLHEAEAECKLKATECQWKHTRSRWLRVSCAS